MANGLKKDGEEYLLKNNIENESVEVSIYNDSKDDLGRSPTEEDITTEPNSITRANAIFKLESVNDRWQFISDSTVTIDVSGSSGDVDSYFVKIDSTGNGDYDTFLISGALEQKGNVDNYDEYKLEPGIGGIFSYPE